MKKYYLAALISFFGIYLSQVSAKELEFETYSGGQKFLTWNSLNMIEEVKDNPFEALTNKQFDLMRLYARNRISLEENLDGDALNAIEKEANNLRKELQKYGLDADQLFETRNSIMEKRLTQMYTPNPEVIGKEWAVAGFMAPIEMDGMRVTSFFLVPTSGACIHLPPPPPNQIILVNSKEGIDIRNLGDAYWVKGEISTEVVTGVASYYDGQSTAEAIYTMEAKEVHRF